MSRTDKDRPYRVKVLDTTLPLVEDHIHHAHRVRSRRGMLDHPDHPDNNWSTGTRVTHVCDLPERGNRRIAGHPTTSPGSCCTREVSSWAQPPWWHSGNPPKDFIAGKWTRPERRRKRDTLREATKTYNTTGDLEGYDYPSFQHRHNATWWWD